MSQRKTYTVEMTDDELKGLTLVLHSIDAKHLVFKPVTAAPSPIAGAVEVRAVVTMSDDGKRWASRGSSHVSEDTYAAEMIRLEPSQEHVVTLVGYVMPPGRRKVPEVAAIVEEVNP